MSDTHVPTQPVRTAPRRSPRRLLMPVLIILCGVSILLYPVIATQWNNSVQQQVVAEYQQLVKAPEHAPTLEKERQSAHHYNDTRAQGPILDPWLARVSKDNVDYQDYLRELSSFPAMGQLIVPSVRIDLPIYHGTDEHTLQAGVGHLYGTDLPVGGKSTHSVLTGHTGLTNSTLFDNLVDVADGAEIYVSVAGERLKYKVYKRETVLPEEVNSLFTNSDEDLLTLITCTPYGINTHRLLVHAQRVPLDSEIDNAIFDAAPTAIWQWWMIAAISVSALVILALVVWLWRQIVLVPARRKIHKDPQTVAYVILPLLLALTILPTPAWATTITGDTTGLNPTDINNQRVGSLTIQKPVPNPFSDVPVGHQRLSIDNIEIRLSRVNDIDLSNVQGWEKARKLSIDEAQKKIVEPTLTALTNANGIATFTDLSVGLYLVEEQAETGRETAPSAPFLITIPVGATGKNTWVYHVEVTTKPQGSTPIPPSPAPPEPTPPAPLPPPPLPSDPLPSTPPSGLPPQQGKVDPPGQLAITGAMAAGTLTIAVGFFLLGVVFKRSRKN